MAKQKKETCIVPNCDRPRVRRGQCNGCYHSSRRLVIKGETTWEELESQGFAEPVAPSGRKRSPAYEAITGNKSKRRKRKAAKPKT